MERVLLQQTVRSVLALCRLAAQCDADDVRTDLADEAAVLLDIAVSIPQGDRNTEAVAGWCRRNADWLQRLRGSDGVDQAELLRATARVLRLLGAADAARPAPESASARISVPRKRAVAVGEQASNKERLLGWISENPDARSRDIIAHFMGEMADRTVTRTLKSLVASGALVRHDSGDGSVTFVVGAR